MLGDRITDDETGLITEGGLVLLQFTLTSTTSNKIYSANWEWMWEIQELVNDFKNSKFYKNNEWNDNIDIAGFTARTMEDEIRRVASDDIPIYIATFAIMFVYLAFNLGSFSCIGARPYLAIISIIVMLMALITSYGIGLAMGYYIRGF